MKHLIIQLSTLTLILNRLSALSLSAAVPLSWTVETTRAQPATFEAYQGETIDFEAALTSRGKTLEAPSNYSFFWQTNGMGNAFWSVPCPSSATTTNVLFATWLPEYDCGSRVYNCFIGSPSNIYHAAFQLRLRPSPGATPNALPLPVPVIDFAKVRVLNPPWSGGGGGGVDTNAVRDIVREQLATNGIRSVDGAARSLPKYLHLYETDDSYPDAAAEYYRSRGNGNVDGGCSSVRDGGFLYRNFDYPFDDRAEFVVKMSAVNCRFASVGVAQVGTNLTERMVTSGKPEYSHLYKWLPGATVDGINENGVACNINVVDGDPQTSGWHNDTGDLHPLAAVRWILDNATSAQQAAEYIASRIAFPQGWTQNFHYMIADAEKTYIVENGSAVPAGWDQPPSPVMTNFTIFDGAQEGSGQERYSILLNHGNITSAWYSLAYLQRTQPGRISDFGYDLELFDAAQRLWAEKPKESHRGETFGDQTWWQTVHTSVYDLTNRVLRVAVQETDDWYVFQVPSSGAKVDAYTKSETDAKLSGKLDTSGDGVYFRWSEDRSFIDTDAFIYSRDGDFIILSPEGYEVHVLSRKLNSVTTSGNSISWDDDGTSLNITAFEVLFDAGTRIRTFGGDVEAAVENPDTGEFDTHKLSDKADRSMISATNQTFSNEVATVARTVQPEPSPTLRLFDPVLNRWVILKSVNMNLTLEVE